MPTYEYKCSECGLEKANFQSIGAYNTAPLVPYCHGPMERKLSVVPTNALSFALAGDRHYEGLRGPNGEDIGSRTKHREFMSQSGLTTMDDFKGHFKEAAKKREEYRTGVFKDPELRQELSKQVSTAINKTE